MVDLIAIQLVSEPDPMINLVNIKRILASLPTNRPLLVVLPECFACFGGEQNAQSTIAEPIGEGSIQQHLINFAKQFDLWLVAGSLPTSVEHSDKFYASSLVYNSDGEQISHYQKIHLFDATVNDTTNNYNESETTLPGNEIALFTSPWGDVGQSICYDLRFPGLFQMMQPANIMVVPSAFTKVTGEAHWDALLKARSIENQCYIIAANQGGVHANGRETYGHSCIYSPWGEKLASLGSGRGWVGASFSIDILNDVRAQMPVHSHNKIGNYYHNAEH